MSLRILAATLAVVSLVACNKTRELRPIAPMPLAGDPDIFDGNNNDLNDPPQEDPPAEDLFLIGLNGLAAPTWRSSSTANLDAVGTANLGIAHTTLRFVANVSNPNASAFSGSVRATFTGPLTGATVARYTASGASGTSPQANVTIEPNKYTLILFDATISGAGPVSVTLRYYDANGNAGPGMTFHATALAAPPIRFDPSTQIFGRGSTHTISATNVSGLSLPLHAISFTDGEATFTINGGTCLTGGRVATPSTIVFDPGARHLAPNETCTIQVNYRGGGEALNDTMYMMVRNGKGAWMTVQGSP